MLKISNDYLINKAANSLLELSLEFLRSGRIIDWMNLISVAYEEALKVNKEITGATNKKRSQNKRSDGKALRKGRGGKGLLRKHKQGHGKRSRKA